MANAAWRAALARVLLSVLAWAEVSPFRPSEAPRRLVRLAWGPQSTGSAAGFWFDPPYAAFLEAVRRDTPEHATISLVTPQTSDLYVYRAAYGLVPRRVVGPQEWASSDFIAVYGGSAPPPVPTGRRIPGGTLLRR